MRIPFIAAAITFIITLALTIGGLSANAPIALIPALLCGLPLFAFFIGIALGRVADQFQLVRRDAVKEPARRRDTPAAPRQQPTPLG